MHAKPELNPQQRQAVRHIDGPLLVLAGAGSGKTRVITEKIAYLLGHCRIGASHIAAVTFTNKAAREMRERVAALVPRQNARGLTVCTFHSLGLRILRTEHAALGYKPGMTIFDAADTLALLKQLAPGDTRDESVAAQAQRLISAWKNELIDADTAATQATSTIEAGTARLYAAYQRHLKAYNAVDFDDLITAPVLLFQAHPEVLEKWHCRLHYLLVDEYQDTNAAQYQLLRLLAGPRGAFTVVGDDDQSVYAWRGAQPQNLARLREDFPTLEVVKLEQNYRSTGRILNTANGLIERNPRLFEKRLWSALGPGEPLRVMPCANGDEEAERVVSELLGSRIRHRRQFGDYAILYRSNHQARPFEHLLRSRSVPYHLSGGQSFFDKTEIKDLVAYLRLLVNPTDDAAFLRIINVPRRELGAATLEKLGTYAGERQLSLFEAAREIHLSGRLPERPARRLRQFTEWAESLAQSGESTDAATIVRTLLRDIDYEQWLHSGHKDRRQVERRLATIGELVDWIRRLSADDEGGGRNLTEVVGHLGLMDIIESRDADGHGDRVHLMTLHAAKGLEFDHVFLVGMEEGTLPHRNSLDQGALEEERRLLYVGITRARRSLTLSFAHRRRRHGELLDCEPSRFLNELPADDLEWEGKRPKLAPQERLQRGEAGIAALRDLLE